MKVNNKIIIILLVGLFFFIIYKNYRIKPIKKRNIEDPKEITWFLENSMPFVNAGAENVAHVFNLYLIEHGYKINVVGNWDEQVYENVNYINSSNTEDVEDAVDRSRIVCSQLSQSTFTVKLAKKENKKVIIFVHSLDNNRKIINNYKNIIDPSQLLVVFNSESIKTNFDESINSFILYPPVDCSKYITKTQNTYVTVVNVSKLKGGNHLIAIAKKMPNIKFLAVKGGYDKQIIDKSVTNITYVENTKDMRSIYAQTDILLIPSNPETWGRTATEAMCSGIPVIAHPTEGLKENMKEAGIYIDRDNIEEWVAKIYELKEDRNKYNKKVEECKKRSKELNSEKQLEGLLCVL